MELQSQQEFIGEMERLYSALNADKDAFEAKASQVEIENAALREEISHSAGIAEVCISFLYRWFPQLQYLLIKGQPTQNEITDC